MTVDRRRSDADLDREANAHLASEIEDIANEMSSVVDELEAAAERKDLRDVDSQFTELRSLFEALDGKHDDLPAVPEVA